MYILRYTLSNEFKVCIEDGIEAYGTANSTPTLTLKLEENVTRISSRRYLQETSLVR